MTQACATTKPIEALVSPLRQWTSETSPCGRQLALDGNGDLWFERRCENGVPNFKRVRKLSPNEVRRVEAAFAPIEAEVKSATSPPSVTDCEGASAHRFTLRDDSGVRFSRAVCGTGKPGEISGLPPVYERAARELHRLE